MLGGQLLFILDAAMNALVRVGEDRVTVNTYLLSSHGLFLLTAESDTREEGVFVYVGRDLI